MEEIREFTDTLLLAYLSVRNFQIKPKQNDKLISFEVSGEGITEAIQQFYDNPDVPILTFCQHYKGIRSALFNLRTGGGHGK